MIRSNVWEIEKEIRLHGQVEWRSKKNLDDYVRKNTFDKDISIVGYITPKTVENGVSLFTVKRLRRINRLMYTLGLEKIKACVTYKEAVFFTLQIIIVRFLIS